MKRTLWSALLASVAALGCRAEVGPNCCLPRAVGTGSAAQVPSSFARVVNSAAAYEISTTGPDAGSYDGLEIELFGAEPGTDCQSIEGDASELEDVFALTGPGFAPPVEAGNYGVVGSSEPEPAADGGIAIGVLVPEHGDATDGMAVDGTIDLSGVSDEHVTGNYGITIQQPDGGTFRILGTFDAPICRIISPTDQTPAAVTPAAR